MRSCEPSIAAQVFFAQQTVVKCDVLGLWSNCLTANFKTTHLNNKQPCKGGECLPRARQKASGKKYKRLLKTSDYSACTKKGDANTTYLRWLYV